jgi:hypothetical protein
MKNPIRSSYGGLLTELAVRYHGRETTPGVAGIQVSCCHAVRVSTAPALSHKLRRQGSVGRDACSGYLTLHEGVIRHAGCRSSIGRFLPEGEGIKTPNLSCSPFPPTSTPRAPVNIALGHGAFPGSEVPTLLRVSALARHRYQQISPNNAVGLLPQGSGRPPGHPGARDRLVGLGMEARRVTRGPTRGHERGLSSQSRRATHLRRLAVR